MTKERALERARRLYQISMTSRSDAERSVALAQVGKLMAAWGFTETEITQRDRAEEKFALGPDDEDTDEDAAHYRGFVLSMCCIPFETRSYYNAGTGRAGVTGKPEDVKATVEAYFYVMDFLSRGWREYKRDLDRYLDRLQRERANSRAGRMEQRADRRERTAGFDPTSTVAVDHQTGEIRSNPRYGGQATNPLSDLPVDPVTGRHSPGHRRRSPDQRRAAYDARRERFRALGLPDDPDSIAAMFGHRAAPEPEPEVPNIGPIDWFGTAAFALRRRFRVELDKRREARRVPPVALLECDGELAPDKSPEEFRTNTGTFDVKPPADPAFDAAMDAAAASVADRIRKAGTAPDFSKTITRIEEAEECVAHIPWPPGTVPEPTAKPVERPTFPWSSKPQAERDVHEEVADAILGVARDLAAQRAGGTPLDDVGLRPGFVQRLKHAGIFTFEELRALSDQELVRRVHLTRDELTDVREFIARRESIPTPPPHGWPRRRR